MDAAHVSSVIVVWLTTSGKSARIAWGSKTKFSCNTYTYATVLQIAVYCNLLEPEKPHKLLYARNMPIDVEHLHLNIRDLTQQLLS